MDKIPLIQVFHGPSTGVLRCEVADIAHSSIIQARVEPIDQSLSKVLAKIVHQTCSIAKVEWCVLYEFRLPLKKVFYPIIEATKLEISEMSLPYN